MKQSYVLLLKGSIIQIQTASGQCMQHQYKSPLKPAAKSSSKLSRSVTLGKRSKYKQQSESKSHAARVKEISDRQPYKNILNRLLRSENLAKFVREAEKYVELTESMVASHKSKSVENEHSRRQFHEYGTALLKDGSFIRYYCKLVEREFHEDRKRIRELFYEKYRHEICLRQKMFNDYFKQEVTPHQEAHLFSFSKSKGKQKKPAHAHDQHHPIQRSKSIQKAKTQASFCLKEIDKGIDNLTTIQHVETSNSLQTKDSKESSESEAPKSQAKKSKIVHFQKDPEEATYEEDNYHSPYLKYQSEYNEHKPSAVKKTRLKSSEKRKSIIVKFSDQIKSNPRLREEYERIIKEKQEREKQNSTKKQQNKPVVRSSVSVNMDFMEIRLRELTEGDLQKMNSVQKEIVSSYPTIHLIVDLSAVTISASKVEGYYKNYIIHKAVITDINHYLEPDYIGIVAEKLKDSLPKGIQPCSFDSDDRIQIILFK